MSKKFPKIFTIIFLFLIILQTGAFVFSTLFYTPTKAAAKWTNPVDQIEIPGLKFSTPTACPDDQTKTCVPWIGEYIAGIYNYAIGIVGILAAIILMLGGVIWLTAGGSPDRVNEAKAWIGASLSGLVLALCSYMILYQINPDLVKLNPLKVNVVTEKKIVAGCGWQKVAYDSTGVPPVDKCSKYNLVKASDDSKCKEKKPADKITGMGAPTTGLVTGYSYSCCCAIVGEIAGEISMCKPAAPYPDYCTACNDCENANIQCKETPCLVNKSLNEKLNALYDKLDSNKNMQITEPWPSTVKHSNACHKDGTCVDVALKSAGATPEETCKYVNDIVNIAKSLGLKVLNEYAACGGQTYDTTTGNNIHIGL